MNSFRASLFALALTFSQISFAFDEPPGTPLEEEAELAERKVAEADKRNYDAKYQNYKVKLHETAMIMFHAKWSAPPAPLASNFTNEKFYVILPTMPWAGVRGYDGTYEEALAEVNALIKKLRNDGFKRIIVAGHSFGGNATIAYAGQYNDVDALMVFAPGHTPDIDRNSQSRLISIAKELIAAGKGDEVISFSDYQVNGRRQMTAKPVHFVSFFDGEGFASMARSASKIQRAIPVLVVMGNGDFQTTKGSSYFFDRLPKHPHSRYLVSKEDHLKTPFASFELALEWLKAVIKE